MGMVYDRENIQIKISHRERQNLEVYKSEACVVPRKHYHPRPINDNVHRVLPTRKVHLSLNVQSFYWRLVMYT